MPDWKKEIRRRLGNLKLTPTREAEIVEELAQHLEDRYEELLTSGLTKVEASRAALAELSGGDVLPRELQRVERPVSPEPLVLGTNRRRNFLSDVWQDLRYGFRMLLKNPVFTGVAVLSLALGIGANTALFSLVDTVLLKTLPVRNPEELVLFKWTSGPKLMSRSVKGPPVYDENGQRTSNTFSYDAFQQLQNRNQVLAECFAFAPLEQLNVNVDGQAEIATGQLVSGGYYHGLGVETALGRLIADSDDRAGASPVIIISHRYWQRRFGLERTVLDRTINVNGATFSIVGVTPPEFHGTLEVGSYPDLSIPLTQEPLVRNGGSKKSALSEPSYWWLHVMGRLKPGVSHEQSRVSLERIYQQSTIAGWAASGESETRDVPALKIGSGSQGLTELREEYSRPLGIMMAVLGLTLLIACANVASLLLVRVATRRKELTVRLALGAGRLRIIRQMLTESILLASCGGVLGVVFAYWGKNLLVTLLPWGNADLALELRLDPRVLAFTAAASLLTGLLFGLAPALHATRIALAPSLNESGRNVSGGSGSLLNRSLIVAQVAMSVLLLVSAGLFIRTMRNLRSVEVGFNRENLLLFRVDPRLNGYKGAQIINLYQQMSQRIEAIPGVRAVTFSRFALLGGGWADSLLNVLGHPSTGQDKSVHVLRVGSNYFETMGIQLLRGHSFTDHDNARSPKVAVINQTLAQKFFPNEDPIGRRFFFGGPSPPNPPPAAERVIEIVGVVRDAKYRSLRQQTPPTVYTAAQQDPEGIGQMTFVVRASGAAATMIPTIRSAVREVDSNLPLFEFATQDATVEQSLAEEQLFTRLTSIFALFALVLASIGLYGVLAYSVAQRTREIGIRMALGAQRSDVRKLVITQGMTLALTGIALGLVAAFALTRVLVSLLYGVKATDPVTFVGVAVLLMAVALLACYIPARRATRVDPLVALRYE